MRVTKNKLKKLSYLKLKKVIKLLFIHIGMIIPLAVTPLTVYALPSGGNVAAGGSTVTTPSSGNMVINQTTDRAIINWQSYNVGNGESVRYNQPNTGSISLNRVVGGSPSSILGSITANGRVWLVNPAGIWFGPSAFVSVSGLLATTADISDSDFMNGNYQFRGNSNAAITNEGRIIINNAGLAAFVAARVSNSGVIEADMGTVVLGASQVYTVDFSGDQLINFAVGGEVDQPDGAQVENSGTIIANGGTVHMHAAAAGKVLNNVINMSGVVQAKSVGVKNGQIILSANAGTVYVSGKINASGKKAGEKGGKVKVLGKQVALLDTAEIDVSGYNGGGEVLIGGDYLGKNAAIPNATYTVFSKNAVINADALTHGDGGRVIVWSNEGTQFFGNIYARGGLQGGNGGFVETSGKNYLNAQGMVYANAYNGAAGLWLLDPSNVTITNAGTSNGSFGGGDPITFTPSADNAIVDVNTIIQALETGTSVTITSSGGAGTQVGNITVASPITVNSGTTPVTLRLEANTPNPGSPTNSAIAINADINAIGGPALAVALVNAAIVHIAGGVTVNTNGGLFISNPQKGATTVDGTINTGTGNLSLIGNSAVINGNLLSTGTINLSNLGTTVIPGAQIGGSAVGVGQASSVIFQSTTGGFTTMAAGDGAVGTYQVTSNAINAVRTSTLTIGAAGNTGAVDIGLFEFGNNLNPAVIPTSINFGSGVSITVSNNIDVSGTSADLSFNLGQQAGNPAEMVFNAGTTTNAGANNITIQTLTAGNVGTSVAFNTANIYSTGDITINTDIVTAGAAGKIGGTSAAGTYAQNINYFPETTSQNISIMNNGGLAGQLSANFLAKLFTNNLTIGSTTAPITGGSITLNSAWSLGTNYNAGATITLQTTGNIALNAGIDSPGILAPNLRFFGSSFTSSGTPTIDARFGTILLDASGGSINLGSSTLTTGSNTITIQNASTVNLGNITNPGSLSAIFTMQNITGAITQSVGTDIESNNMNFLNIAGNVTLLNSNDFSVASGGNFNVTTNGAGVQTFQFRDRTNFGLNNITMANDNLVIFADSGPSFISQKGTGTVTIGGTSSFTAGGSITLMNATNNFIGAVSLNNTGANNVSIVDVNAIVLGTSSVGSGTLSVTGVGITQTGGITQAIGAGNATFNAQTGSVTLTNAGNALRGNVLATATGPTSDVSIVNSVGLTTGKITATRNVSLTTTSGNIHIGDEIDPVDVMVNSAGTITQAMTGIINATGTLTTTSVGGTTLDATNNVANVDMTNSGSGDILFNNQAATLGVTAVNQTAGSTTINNTGNVSINGAVNSNGTVLMTATGAMNLGAVVTSNAIGDAIQLVTDVNFAYTAGDLIANNGRWLVWSINPALDTNPKNIPSGYDFTQYNAFYPTTTVAQASGNGLLYEYAPTINPILVGTITKYYDGNTSASNITPANYSYNSANGATGTVAGDTLTVTGPATGQYGTPNPGQNIFVTSNTPLVLIGVDSNGKAVYGYQSVALRASGNIGIILPIPATPPITINIPWNIIDPWTNTMNPLNEPPIINNLTDIDYDIDPRTWDTYVYDNTPNGGCGSGGSSGGGDSGGGSSKAGGGCIDISKKPDIKFCSEELDLKPMWIGGKVLAPRSITPIKAP